MPPSMSVPSVSVVMPAYNHERFVGAAIESVLNQTVSDLELIVVDDGSTDATAAVVTSYDDERIRYHYQDNQDAYNALNNGMGLSRGRCIAIINSDDVYEETRLERMMQVHEALGADCIFSDVTVITDTGEPVTDPSFWWIQWHENNRRYYFDYKDLYAAFLHANIMVTTSNLFMSRQAMETVGDFAPLRYLHDYDYIFRLLNAFPDSVVYLHDEKLLQYRLHGSNTLSQAAVIGREQDLTIIRDNLLRKCPEDLHDYLNIGIDRIIALEHELVQARAELEAATAAESDDRNAPAGATRRPFRRLINKLFR